MVEFVEKPWGSYIDLDEGEGYRVKRITVNPGHRLSLQKHSHRSERWVVVRGVADVIQDGGEFSLSVGETAFIDRETAHRLGNSSESVLEIVEVQLGEYLGEDDITRLEDDYDRLK